MVERSTLFCVFAIEGVGLKAARKTSGIPSVTPPSSPPQLFVAVSTRPFLNTKASLFPLPRRRAAAKPAPNSAPLTAGIAKSSAARRPSSPSNSGPPSPAGRPKTAHSTTPPSESPSSFAAAIAAFIASARSSLSVPKAQGRESSESSPPSAMPPSSAIRDRTRTPRRSRYCRQRPPARHSAAVMRPEYAPPPGAIEPVLTHAA